MRCPSVETNMINHEQRIVSFVLFMEEMIVGTSAICYYFSGMAKGEEPYQAHPA